MQTIDRDRAASGPSFVTAPFEFLNTVIGDIKREAVDVVSFELLPTGTGLPPFTAGAHIDVHLPELQARSYSLINGEGERDRYVIAVRKEAAGRGGSRYMHERLKQRDRLIVSPPRNNFPLVEDASHIVFIAGGIGITPIWCMIQRLQALGRSWELHYCARTDRHAAFHDPLREIDAAQPGRVHFHFDGGMPDRMIDIRGTVDQVHKGAHLYCCGPLGMLTAFREATRCRPADRIHMEYFSAGPASNALGGFEVELARSGKTVFVEPGKSILHALLELGIDAPHSCQEGVCGSCETQVLDGIPEHRDLVLTPDERASGRTMMICCSGCLGEKLVLDM
jgi:vanillate O-demethylase ferredoxin subunit